MSIPKIIHYCWLSGSEYPELVQKCMASWHSLLPDYEFMLWDMERVKEIDSLWMGSAIDAKKWAFAADYIRLYALNKYGGIYLDCDVLVKRPFNDLLEREYFIGRERRNFVLEAAVIGSCPDLEWLKFCLEFYKNKVFDIRDLNKNSILLPYVMKNAIEGRGLTLMESSEIANEKGVFNYFPYVYFSPCDNMSGEIEENSISYCVHLFNGNWASPYQKRYLQIKKTYGAKFCPLIGGAFALLFSIKEFFLKKYSRI